MRSRFASANFWDMEVFTKSLIRHCRVLQPCLLDGRPMWGADRRVRAPGRCPGHTGKPTCALLAEEPPFSSFRIPEPGMRQTALTLLLTPRAGSLPVDGGPVVRISVLYTQGKQVTAKAFPGQRCREYGETKTRVQTSTSRGISQC